MIARWPWGNYWEHPDEDRLAAFPPEGLTVYPADDEDPTPVLLGPDGEPIRYVPPHPIGFTSARLPSPESETP